eukprot:12899588-Prorocentrum_lima.AAC.1
MCRVTDIIPRDGITIEEEVPTLVLLGIVVEVVEDRWVMHRRPCLEDTLKKRSSLAPNFGKENLPEPQG